MDYCDLFSGIGGISLALSGIVNTVLYCDHEKYCQQVLAARMTDGSIDRAPIHGDIRTLHLGSGCKPVMIGGGFPCQDISTSGLQKGIIGGDRSSLFYEVVRLIDETPSVQYVFLENVSNIIKCGMKEVVEELAEKRGWTMQWTMKSAASLGAPHQRNRWFCLATRQDSKVVPIESEEPRGTWQVEHEPRISFKPDVTKDPDPSFDPNWIARCQALGNSVVPCVVRSAFIELWNAAQDVGRIVKSLSAYTQDVSNLDYPYPESGIIFQGKFLGLEGKRTRTTTSVSICVAGANMSALPTPRRGITHASAVTERSVHDLPTVLLNSSVALDYIRDRLGSVPEKIMSVCVPNVNYIEWMMGYRPDWTRIYSEEPVKKKEYEYVSSHTKSRINGMHIFMRENPGKDVRTIAAMWRELSDDDRTNYTKRAKSEH